MLFARLLAYVLSPLLFPPLLFTVVLTAHGVGRQSLVWLVGAVVIFGCAFPLAAALRDVRTGRSGSIELAHAAERRRPYIAAAIGFAVVAAVAALTDAGVTRSVETALSGPADAAVMGHVGTALPVILAVMYAVNSLLVAAAAYRWKPSVHAASAACFVSLLVFLEAGLSPVILGLLILLIPLIGWARWRTGAHSVSEVIVGSLGGLLLPPAELLLAMLAGWL